MRFMAETDIGAMYVAIISLISTVIVGVLNYISNQKLRNNQKELEKINNTHEKELERLKNELASERSEENAEREYNYDARKRIYNECLPHLFRFIRKAQAWPAKFDAIVKHAKDGDIVRIDRDGKSQPVRLGDLKANNYFKVHTLYLLFAPIAAVKIFEEKLTTLDLNLDKNVAIQYKLDKALFYSFSTDNHFAGTCNMKLHYREHKINKYNRLDDGDRQGLRGYEIDVITPFFIRSLGKSGAFSPLLNKYKIIQTASSVRW
jgi:hypothetical protein